VPENCNCAHIVPDRLDDALVVDEHTPCRLEWVENEEESHLRPEAIGVEDELGDDAEVPAASA